MKYYYIIELNHYRDSSTNDGILITRMLRIILLIRQQAGIDNNVMLHWRIGGVGGGGGLAPPPLKLVKM